MPRGPRRGKSQSQHIICSCHWPFQPISLHTHSLPPSPCATVAAHELIELARQSDGTPAGAWFPSVSPFACPLILPLAFIGVHSRLSRSATADNRSAVKDFFIYFAAHWPKTGSRWPL